MAKIVFHSAAYWGDVMPYVPIANKLVERGHDVTYALPVGHHSLLAGERFQLADSGNPASPAHVAGDAEHEQMLERHGMTLAGAVSGRYYIREWVVQYLRQGFDALTALDADLFVTHPTAAVCTRTVSDATGVPMVTGHLFPMVVDLTLRIPKVLRPAAGLGLYDRDINRFRRQVGVAPLAAAGMTAGFHDGMLVLSSPRYTPAGPRWEPSWRLTGFTLWDGPLGQQIDPAVAAYLDAGAPPVLVTLGSAAASVAHKLFETVAVRLDDIGQRALFLVGDIRNVPLSMRDRPDLFAFAPLTQVLSRCRAIVQSGSHGTNAAALTAGVPNVTVPFIFDQVWHAKRTQALGLGVMVRGKRRRAERVWAALDRVLGDDGYTSRARAFAASLDGEDGITTAADAIERAVP